MHPFFSSVKAVGFDLDRTLYQDTPEMRERVAKEVSQEILKIKPDMNRCLERAGIISLIKADPELVRIMNGLRQKFFLFLITKSSRNQTVEKLAKIGLAPELFNFTLCGDDPFSLADPSSKNFGYFLSQSPYVPSEHVFIGDNLQTDIIKPKTLGMKTIFVGQATPEADFSIADIHEIENLLLP